MKQSPLTIVRLIKKDSPVPDTPKSSVPDQPVPDKAKTLLPDKLRIDCKILERLKGSYVCQLDHLATALGTPPATYEVDQNLQSQLFTCEVTWENQTAIAIGSTIKKSKQNAAGELLELINQQSQP